MVLIHCLAYYFKIDGLFRWIEIDDWLSTPKNFCDQFQEGKKGVNFKIYLHSPHIHSICARVVFIWMFVNRKPCRHYPRALSFLRSRRPLSALLASSSVSTRRPESSIRTLEMVHELHVIKTRQKISDRSTHRVSSAMSVWSLTRM